MSHGTKLRLPPGVTIRRYGSGREVLNVTFWYDGRRYREPLPLAPTTTNVRAAASLLGRVNAAIVEGRFDYREFFPNSPRGRAGVAGTTCGDYLERWLAHAEARGLAYSTTENYKRVVRALRPLHAIPAARLTRADLRDYVAAHPVSLKTLRNRFSVLHMALQEAIIDGLITHNPVDGFSARDYRPVTPKAREVDPLLPDEVEKILAAAATKPALQNLIAFALATGLRTSELLALRWQNCHLPQRTVLVCEALVMGQLKTPKTAGSKRYVELDDAAVAALTNQYEITGLQVGDGGLVFLNPTNDRPWHERTLHDHWRKTLINAGVRHRKAYQTRHTYATRQISQGKNVWWIARQMGHNSPKMLFDHYGAYVAEYENLHKQRD